MRIGAPDFLPYRALFFCILPYGRYGQASDPGHILMRQFDARVGVCLNNDSAEDNRVSDQ